MRRRTPDGRLAPLDALATPAARRELLLAQLATGASLRTLAEERGLGKSSVAKYLRLAKQEQAAAELEVERRAEPQPVEPNPEPLAETLAESAPPANRRAPELEEVPAAKVWLAGQDGLRRVRGGRVSSRSSLVLPRRRYSEGQMAVIESNERAALLRQAFARAGLSPDGMATYQTSLGRGSYDPGDRSDVARVRTIIRADDGPAAARAWRPHPGLR